MVPGAPEELFDDFVFVGEVEAAHVFEGGGEDEEAFLFAGGGVGGFGGCVEDGAEAAFEVLVGVVGVEADQADHTTHYVLFGGVVFEEHEHVSDRGEGMVDEVCVFLAAAVEGGLSGVEHHVCLETLRNEEEKFFD